MINRLIPAILLVALLACKGNSDTQSTPKPPVKNALTTQGIFRPTQTPPVPAMAFKAQATAFASSTPVVNRVKHQATLLADGRVLLSGGTPSANDLFQIFNPVDETFITLPPTSFTGIHRYGHCVVPLSDTQYLLVGGDDDHITSGESWLEIFDSTTNTVSVLPQKIVVDNPGKLSFEKSFFAVKSGNNVMVFNDSRSGVYWNINISTWEITEVPNTFLGNRAGFTMITDATNTSYLIGGWDYSQNTQPPLKDVLKIGSDFSISKIGDLSVARAYASAVLLPNNKIGIYGGTVVAGGESTDTVEEFSLDTNTSTVVGTLQLKGAAFVSQILQNGYVFHGGGVTDFGKLVTNAQQIFDHASDLSGYTNVMNRARVFFTSTMLNNGRLLIIGGEKSTETNPIAEIFEPQSGIYVKLQNQKIPLGETIDLTGEYSGTSLAFTVDKGTVNSVTGKTANITMPTSFGNGLVKVTVTDPNNTAVNKAEVYLKLDNTVVSISTTTSTFDPDQQYQFTASVNYFAEKGVTWTTTDGTIDANGLFKMPTTHSSPITITATIKATAAKAWKATFVIQ